MRLMGEDNPWIARGVAIALVLLLLGNYHCFCLMLHLSGFYTPFFMVWACPSVSFILSGSCIFHTVLPRTVKPDQLMHLWEKCVL